MVDSMIPLPINPLWESQAPRGHQGKLRAKKLSCLGGEGFPLVCCIRVEEREAPWLLVPTLGHAEKSLELLLQGSSPPQPAPPQLERTVQESSDSALLTVCS